MSGVKGLRTVETPLKFTTMDFDLAPPPKEKKAFEKTTAPLVANKIFLAWFSMYLYGSP